MPTSPGRREEDRNGNSISIKLENIEANVAERDTRNRKDIHELRNGQQSILDKIHKVELDIEPWTGSMGLLSKISRDVVDTKERVTGMEIAHTTTREVLERVEKAKSRKQYLIIALLGLLLALLTYLGFSKEHTQSKLLSSDPTIAERVQ